jgi:hypothetical protein
MDLLNISSKHSDWDAFLYSNDTPAHQISFGTADCLNMFGKKNDSLYIYIIKHFTNILYNGKGKIYNFSKVAESIVKWQRTEKLYDKQL